MMITLDDVHQILGVRVEGNYFNSVKVVTDIGSNDAMTMAAEGLGITRKDVSDECDKAFMVRLQWIKDKWQLRAKVDSKEEELDKCARGYILYLLGTDVFPNKTKNKIYVYYLRG